MKNQKAAKNQQITSKKSPLFTDDFFRLFIPKPLAFQSRNVGNMKCCLTHRASLLQKWLLCFTVQNFWVIQRKQ